MSLTVSLLIELVMLTVDDMPTPQLQAAAPLQPCPLCGRRMQHFNTTETTHSYACYSHDIPYYVNVHYKFLDPDGRIREMLIEDKRKGRRI